MVPSGSARVELVQRATTFALLAALKAQDNPTKLNLAGMRWPNPPPKRDIRDLHQFSFFSYEKWSKISTPAPLRRPPRPPRSWRRELGTRRMAKYGGAPNNFFFARWRRSVWPTPWPQGGLAPNRKGFSQKVKLRSKSGKQTRAERAESEQKASRKRAESKKSQNYGKRAKPVPNGYQKRTAAPGSQ